MNSDALADQLQRSLGTAYSLERELGGGGMSRVFVARENALGRSVVIKVLPAELAGQLSIDRFRREIALAARLQHPHIVPLLSAGEVGGLPYFTMPFVRGESLRVRLATHGELPVNEAIRVLREVASALASAHDQGVVHRDIKPDNVLLSGDAAMVTDFGVAKAVNASSTAGGSSLTSVGIALGTPAYMAPEQASADPLTDSRADIYSWGILAYEVLTGVTPFTGRPPQMMLAAHVTESPDSVVKRRPNTPAPLAQLITRCLEKRPSDRPQRAQELVRALDAIAIPSAGTDPTMIPATDARAAHARSWSALSSRTRGTIVASALAVIVLGVLGVVLGTKGDAGGTPASDKRLAPSVAVLPFVNVGGDSGNAYFADGLTDDLAAALAHSGKLRVAARSSAYAFKGKNPGPGEVGKQLNVSSIVEGSVQRAGGRVKVIASLVTSSDGLTLWSDSYERDANDVFAVQAELSQAIASALRVSISGEEVARNIGTKNVQAHDLVLRGRFLNDVYTEASLRQAIARFQQALALDSTYADAWAGIAESWTRLADDFIAPHEALPHIREAVARALALDPASATVMAQRGSLAIQYDRDYATGMRLLERALRADSTDTGAFLLYATALRFTGHPDSSRAVLQRALRLDPLSPLLTRAAAFTLSRLGDTSGARTACERAIELQPTNVFCRLDQEFWAGRGARYVDSLRAVTHDSSYGRLRLALFEASASQTTSARRSVEVVLANARAHHRYMREVMIAACYAAIGDKEETLHWLERAYASDAGDVANVPSMREFRLLDGDPRFEALIRKIGLPKIR